MGLTEINKKIQDMGLQHRKPKWSLLQELPVQCPHEGRTAVNKAMSVCCRHVQLKGPGIRDLCRKGSEFVTCSSLGPEASVQYLERARTEAASWS